MRLPVSAWFPAALSALLVPGCFQMTAGTGTGTDPGTGAAAADAASGSQRIPIGTGCGTDPQTGANLCAGVDICPGLGLDPSAWPACGFRVQGGTLLDLECVCGSALCPIGVAATCAQASQLLVQQNDLMVCQQVSEGRCVALAPPDAGGLPSTCNPTCQLGCGTAPDCRQLCGC
jgi:hypothetical protein